MMYRVAFVVFVLLFTTYTALPFPALAENTVIDTTLQGNYSTPEFLALTSIPGVQEAANSRSLAILLNNLYRICIGAAAVIAVLKIVQGGVTYMLGDSVTEKKEAKHHIQMAVLGVVFILSPYLVFQVIDPRILKLDVDVSGLAPGAPGVSYDDLPSTCRQYANMYSYVPEPSPIPQRECRPDTFAIPKSCCAGSAENAICCGTNGGPGSLPDPGSAAWCAARPPITDGSPIDANGDNEGCCRARSGAIVVGADGQKTCRIQSPYSIRSCTLVGSNASRVEQCTSSPGCSIQGAGADSICSCGGQSGNTPVCRRTTNIAECTGGTGCFYQDGICGCPGS